MNPNDEIREKILRLLYEIHTNAHSPNQAKVTKVVILSKLREQGYQSNEILSNLDYLVQTKWVVLHKSTFKMEHTNPITRKTESANHEQIHYGISANGIDRFAGPSDFQTTPNFTGINIENVQGVVVVGNGNVVRNEYQDIYKTLEILKQEIGKCSDLADDDKISYQADIDTIKSQLAKPSPSKSIVQVAWQGLSGLATIEGLIQFYQRVAPLIEHLVK